ncbi:MAG TPA: thioredoxin family protein [Acidobacteriota bacterium]|nr:thioredoxin family protein [Acidobacteriota bacterium]
MPFKGINKVVPTLSLVGIVLLLPDPLRGISFQGGPKAVEITREMILATGLEWQEKYDKYEPEADIVDALKAKIAADLKIDVYLGLWCPDSRNNVPLFIKILDRIGTSAPVRYFNVPKKANKDVMYFVEDLKVDRVPTFIFYRDGMEIGRIVEKPKTGMIEDFAEIILK